MCVFNFQGNFWILVTHIIQGKWAVVIRLIYYFVYGMNTWLIPGNLKSAIIDRRS